MFKPRYKIIIQTNQQTIHLDGYKTIQQARLGASLWAREGYGNIIIRKQKRSLTDNAHHILLVILFVSPWLILAGLGL